MTLGDLRIAAAAFVGLDLDDAAEVSLIDSWVSEAIVQVLGDVKPTYTLVPNLSIPSSSNGVYSLDALVPGAIAIYAIVPTTYGQMEQTTLDEIQMKQRNQVVASGGMSRFYALLGEDSFIVYPAPTEALVVDFWVVPGPQALTNEAYDLRVNGKVPIDAQPLVRSYVLKLAALKDNDTASQYGQHYEQLYMQAREEYKTKQAMRGGGKLPPIKVYGRGSSGLARDIYPRDLE